MSYECQILVCSTEKELPWLNACLRSVQKYWTGSVNPIVVLTPECRRHIPEVVTELGCYVVFKTQDMHDCVRMTADSYLSAPLVLFLDARELFTEPCDVSTFEDQIRRPVVFTEPYSRGISRHSIDIHCIQARRALIDRLLGLFPEYEYTSHAPFLFYRHSIRRLRESMEYQNKRPMNVLVTDEFPDNFSSMNFMAEYCHKNETASYEWLPSTAFTHSFIQPFWGVRDPLKGEDLKEINQILIGS